MENETGSELFTRLLSSQKKCETTTFTQCQNANPILISQLESILAVSKPLNLDDGLFSTAIGSREVVEIYGRIGVGKSELLMHLMSRCLVPPKWKIPRKKSLDRQAPDLGEIYQ